MFALETIIVIIIVKYAFEDVYSIKKHERK